MKKSFKMPNTLEMVGEFHTTFGHPLLDSPQIPDEKRCALRVELIREELQELQEAINDKDLVAVADALADIQYVLSGAVHEFGLGEAFFDLFSEVQRSNMSKACKSLEEAEETIAFFKKEQDVDCYYKEVDGQFLVFRSSDNKTMKSIYYSPAQLREVLEASMTKKS